MKQAAKKLDAVLARFSLIPSALFILLPALAVRAAFVPVAPDAAHLWPDAFLGDLRAWWKAVLVIGCGLWMIAGAALRMLSGWRPHLDAWTAAIGAAVSAVVISALASSHPNTAWLGYTAQYEGAWVLAAYLAGSWYIAETADTEKKEIILARVILAVCLVNACHGIAEGLGWNPWRTGIGEWLMGVESSIVTFRFSDTRMAYGTVYQPNHYGMLMAMLGALSLAMVRADPARWWKALWGVGYAGSLGAVFCSNSRTGILTLLLASAVYGLGAAGRMVLSGGGVRGIVQAVKRRRLLAGGLLAATLLLFGVVLPRGVVGRFITRLGSVSSETVEYEIESVGLVDNRIGVKLRDTTLTLKKQTPDSWEAVDEKTGGRTVMAGIGDKPGWLRVSIPGIEKGVLRFRPQGNASLTAPGVDMEFYAIGSDIWAVDQKSMRLTPTTPMSGYTPNGWEGFFNRRGYIWRRALEVFKNAPWIGSGPGTFAQAFPNWDLLNMARFSTAVNEDKGHGIWATFLVQMGAAGTLLYLLPFVMAMVLTLAARSERGLRIPIFMAMAAYCVCSLTNDSTVGVTPIVCALAGMGVAEYRRTVSAQQSE